MNTFILMTEHNILGQEIIKEFLEENISISGVLIEKGSKLSDQIVSYLRGGFYEPPGTYDLLNNQPIPVYFTDNHNNDASIHLLKRLDFDIAVLGGTRLLTTNILAACHHKVVNVHPGLIPQYRGLDVVGWSILNGDPVGSTCHFAVEEPDAGPILLRESIVYNDKDLLTIRIKNLVSSVRLMVKCVQNIDTIMPYKPDLSDGKRYFSMSQEDVEKVERILGE